METLTADQASASGGSWGAGWAPPLSGGKGYVMVSEDTAETSAALLRAYASEYRGGLAEAFVLELADKLERGE